MNISPRRPIRRAAVGALAGALALSGAVTFATGPAGAVEGFAFERLQGQDRYITAAEIARDSFTSSARVVLASGEERNFPDALTGNYLAGFADAPILLTETQRLPSATLQALRDLRTTRVTIIGGINAVSENVARSLRDAGFTVDRIEGIDRYETAARVGGTIPTSYVGSVDGRRTAILGNGQNFPDILAASPASFEAALPITITRPESLPAETESELRELEIQQVIIVGGPAAVSTAVENRVRQIVGNVRRIAGTGRYETARDFANFELAELGFANTHVNLARGDRFPDALAGGPHAGRDNAPIILTPPTTLAAAAEQFLEANDCTLRDGHIFGGTAAVSTSVENRAEEVAGTCEGGQPSPSPSGTASPSPSPSGSASPAPTPSGSPGAATPQSCNTSGTGGTASPSPSPSDSPTATMSPSPTSPTPTASETPTAVTMRPELTAVAFAGEPTFSDAGTADTRDDFCQTSVRFTFDEPVIGKAPTAARFVLVGFDATTRFPGQSAVIEEGGTNVLVTFGRGDNPTTTGNERQDVGERQIDNISLAIVDEDAVRDQSASPNPVGDLPLGVSRSVPVFPAGITAAPDLLAVTLGSPQATTTSVRFDFDEAVGSVVKNTGFHVVTAGNRDNTCASPFISGSSVTVTCATTSTDPVVRGYVEAETVSDEPAPDGADGNLNPLQAERITEDARTIAPDLVSAEFRPNARDENNDDQVLFTFDEPVFVGDATNFVVYQVDTDEVRSISAIRQADPTQVLATFPDEVVLLGAPLLGSRTPALDDAVGVSVLEGAVIEAGDANRPNQEDELAVLNAARDIQPAGRTNGPDLLSVTVDADNNTATFTFDEELAPEMTVATEFVLFEANGTRLVCQAAVTDGATVMCTAFGGLGTSSPDNAVVGTADDAAVEDNDGTANPEGAAGVTP